MKSRRHASVLSVCVMLMLPGSLGAQEQTGRIQGIVLDEATQRPMSGVQVSVEGTGIGLITNEQGRYLLLNVPAGEHVVRAQTIGYSASQRTVTVLAGETTTVDFALGETAVALDEIVVTGTAAQVRRKEIGNSIATVSAREIENVPVINTQDILAGRAAGVTIMANSGQPGAGGSIKIRGTNSVSQDQEPLIYVDGVRIFNEPTRAGWGARATLSPLQDIAAEDIERIEVVKGAAATTLYGTEASSGVIQIFTKRGIAGPALWTAEVGLGFNTKGRWSSDADPSEQYLLCGNTDLLYGLILSDDSPDYGQRQYFEDPTCPSDGDWTDPGAIQRYNLSVRGGSERTTYFVSGNFSDDKGVLPTQNSRDGGFRANLTFTPFEELSFAVSNAYTRRNTRFMADGNNAEGFLLNVGRGHAGYMQGGKEDDCIDVPSEKLCTTNGYVLDSENFARSDHFTAGLTVQYNPTSSFANRLTLGYDYTDINNETTLPFAYLTLPEGYYWDENTRHTKVSIDYAGSLSNAFGESLTSTFSWGGQIFRDRHRWFEIDVQSFAGPGEPTLESGAELTYRADRPVAETNAGVFLQEQLGWNDRLFITAGLRVDGNSAFGDDFGLQPYPKLSASYVISEAAFWPAWWETLKLRAAVGESGKAPSAFAKVRTWSPVSGDDGEPGFTPDEIGNSEVGPERTREFEAGFDASMFSGRLGVEFTAFEARTFEALVGVTYPPSLGFLASREENVGEIVNRGLELSTNFGVLRTSALDWRLRFSGTLLSSEAIDLDDGRPDTTTFATGLNSEIREGFAVPTYFGTKLMNPDALEAPIIESDQPLGSVYPTTMLGFGTTLMLFDRLTLDALAEFHAGHVVQNYTGYQSSRRGAWHPCFPIQEKLIAYDNGDLTALNDVRALDRARCAISSTGTGPETVGYDIAYWTEPGDFTKLRYVALTYDLPQNLLAFTRSASITLSGRNLFTWTDYTGADPEMNDGADQLGSSGIDASFGRRDYYQIPPARQWVLSFRVGF